MQHRKRRRVAVDDACVGAHPRDPLEPMDASMKTTWAQQSIRQPCNQSRRGQFFRRAPIASRVGSSSAVVWALLASTNLALAQTPPPPPSEPGPAPPSDAPPTESAPPAPAPAEPA